MPKAILFDLDGTLADTAKDFFEILRTRIAREKINRKTLFTYQDFRSTAGLGAAAMVAAGYEIDKNDPKFKAYVEEFLAQYNQTAGTHAVLFAGIPELLNRLNVLNIPWAIVTDKMRAFTDKVSVSLRLPPHVSVCSDDKEIGPNERKPNPKSLLVACEKMHIDPSQHECIYVGDSVKDIEAGKKANMTTVAVTYGYTTKENLIKSGADFYVDSPTELATCLSVWLSDEKKLKL